MQNDFIIALAWPEGMVSACGSWYDVFFAKNKKYRVGHSALVLVEVLLEILDILILVDTIRQRILGGFEML